jgi:hypothetical protein
MKTVKYTVIFELRGGTDLAPITFQTALRRLIRNNDPALRQWLDDRITTMSLVNTIEER